MVIFVLIDDFMGSHLRKGRNQEDHDSTETGSDLTQKNKWHQNGMAQFDRP